MRNNPNRKPNDVGVAWKKENENGRYISIALELDVLMEMTGGAVDEVYLSMYPITSNHPKAPDFQVKFYPTKGSRAVPAGTSTRVNERPKFDDDDVPFAHVELYARLLPRAQVHRLAGRDHQLNNRLSEVAADIRRLEQRSPMDETRGVADSQSTRSPEA